MTYRKKAKEGVDVAEWEQVAFTSSDFSLLDFQTKWTKPVKEADIAKTCASANQDYTGTATADMGWYVSAQYMDDKTNRLVVDFSRPLQVGEASEDEKDVFPLEIVMSELTDSEDESKGLSSPEYEILMNYGVWPNGDSVEVNQVMGDDLDAVKPWVITFPVVASSTVTPPAEDPATDAVAATL